MRETPDIVCVGGKKTPTINERQTEGFSFNKFKQVFPKGVVLVTSGGNELYIPPRTFAKVRRRVQDLEGNISHTNYNSTPIDSQEIQNLYDSVEIAEVFTHLAKHGPVKSKKLDILPYGEQPIRLILDVASQVDYLLPLIKNHMDENKSYAHKMREKKIERGGLSTTNPTYVFRLGGYPILVSIASESPKRLIFKTLYEKGGRLPNNTCHIDYEVI